ncbi:DHH family phosphoesterase [Thermoflexibacter ruber]|uniref:Phosphoesterase RecJ domain-containing protein n=1 Tax=Thermoflexibacter ruber TaxID=1003 RepID=A0A1I2G2D3_9BACT|nr:bifunctional oligoribonuclease/PAP phosphatase NrnA [Thermoflexibacter ruber]SFF10926.1 phosphoesterase RecJ domain-containing protein [Thermoflexibacter ruber]
MQNIEELKRILSSPKKVVIIPHQKPDADALGSCLALKGYLNKLQHEVQVISPTDYPQFLAWMPENESVLMCESYKETICKQIILQADVIFCLDYSDLARIAPLDTWVSQASAIKVMIDHHIDRKAFAQFELWKPEAAATAELVYDFILLMGDEALIDIPIAECIYAGILTDTGSFKYPSTSSKIHRIVAKLIDIGINHSKIHHYIYDTNSENRLRLIGFALKERLTILREYRTAYFALSSADLRNHYYQTGDTEGLVNYALSLEGIIFAAILIEDIDKIKLSFRSIGDFSVNDLARIHFSGGGHKNAAGGRVNNAKLEEVVQQFVSILPNYKEQLISV